MSKSNSLNKSNSTESEHELGLSSTNTITNGSMITEEGKNDGNESMITDDDDGYNGDVSSINSYFTTNSNNNETEDERADITPSSPPPSYEFVLEETRLKHQESNQSQSPTTPQKAQEIMHKSSKELYKAVAKQFGITCKMSDQCRCYDCQSHYFDCEYEKNEQEKTDGGLGAGTPVFLHEVMQGTACNIL